MRWLNIAVVAFAVSLGLLFGNASDSGNQAEASIPGLKVIVVAGITSNTAGANDLRSNIVSALGGLVDASDIEWASYDSNNPASYTKEDTCRGVDGVGANINRIMAENPGSRFVLIGHSLGGFAISKWAAQSGSLSAVAKVITLDSPLDLGPTPDAALDIFAWHCSRLQGDTETNPSGYSGLQWCGTGISDGRCTTFSQLTDGGIQSQIRGLPQKVPLATFDCTGGSLLDNPPNPCLNTAASEVKTVGPAICAALPVGFQQACLAYVVLGITVHTDLPDRWRHRTFYNVSEGHGFYTRPDVKNQVAWAVQDQLIEVGQSSVGALCPSGWTPDFNGDWVEGAACRTTATSTYSLPNQDNVLGLWFVYGGDLGAQVKVGNGPWVDLVPESTCARYPYREPGFFSRKLCWWFYANPPSNATNIVVKTTQQCGWFGLGCKTFYLDAMEVVPNVPGGPGNPEPPGPGDPDNPPPADTTPPVISVAVTPPPNGNGWNNENVFVNWTIGDPESGIASSSGCNDVTLTNETGGTILSCTATNGAGLTSTLPTPWVIRIDKTPPTTTASLDPPTPNGKRGWYISDVTVCLSASDPVLADGSLGSDVASTKYRVNGGAWQDHTGCFVVGTESWDNDIDFYSTDNADNVEAEKDVHFKLDKTPPEVDINEGILDGLHWDQVHLERGLLTNTDMLAETGDSSDNLCLWEVRAVDTDIPQMLDTDAGPGQFVTVIPPPVPMSMVYDLDAALHVGINNTSTVAEDCAGWEADVDTQEVYVVPGPYDPRSKGFWYNAVDTGKYTPAQMQTLLDYVNVVSDTWGPAARNIYGLVTMSNHPAILNTNSTNPENMQKAQLLAVWLNLVSGRMAVLTPVNMSTVKGWIQVVDNTSGSPLTFALNVPMEIEEVDQTRPAGKSLYQIAKNLAEGMNMRWIVP